MDQLIYDVGFGVLPKRVMIDKNLSIQAKAIFAYLCTYAGNTDNAFPGRQLITYQLGISKDTFTKYLKELKDKGYIEVYKREREKGKFSHNVYKLVPCPKLSDTVTPDTVNQDTNKNKDNKNKYNNIYSLVIEKLNDLANTSYKATTKKTQSLIRARVEEGFTVEDFYKVIEIKVSDWKGTEFEKYIRPETLFGSKFENYLNQKVKPKQEKTINEDTDFYPNMDFETI